MAVETPSTLAEWETYIGTLKGAALWSQVVNANTQKFVDALMDEGMSMADVHQILVFFVRQIVGAQGRLPERGAFDLHYIARTDPVALVLAKEPYPASPSEGTG